MKPLLLILTLFLSPQRAAAPPEIVMLQREFIKATEDYKVSLKKLGALYEDNVVRLERKLTQSKGMLSEGKISRVSVEEDERNLAAERAKVNEIARQLALADEQIKNLPSENQLIAEYKRATKQRRRSRKPTCQNWTLTAYQRETRDSISFGYKLVCEK